MTYNVFGWQRPCYLLSDEGYAPTYRSLIEDTEWEKYGVGRNPRCDNCMAHCGFEGTAVNDAFSHPLKALKAALQGPRDLGADGARVALQLRRGLQGQRRGGRSRDSGHLDRRHQTREPRVARRPASRSAALNARPYGGERG